jgi:hypothetical protein
MNNRTQREEKVSIAVAISPLVSILEKRLGNHIKIIIGITVKEENVVKDETSK